MCRRDWHVYILAIALLHYVLVAAADFHEDEFVPTSRRAQFSGVRTHWHDVLGRHCPRFGVDHLVALPIPEPRGFTGSNNYKLQLTFDGDRLVTPWLKILGKGAPETPMLKVSFVRTQEALRSVSTQVVPVPPAYLYAHHQLLEEFRNTSHWPKHLLIQYSFALAPTVDALAGLYVVFILCLLAFMAIAVSVVVTYETKLKAFMADMAGDEGLPAVPAVKGE